MTLSYLDNRWTTEYYPGCIVRDMEDVAGEVMTFEDDETEQKLNLRSFSTRGFLSRALNYYTLPFTFANLFFPNSRSFYSARTTTEKIGAAIGLALSGATIYLCKDFILSNPTEVIVQSLGYPTLTILAMRLVIDKNKHNLENVVEQSQ